MFPEVLINLSVNRCLINIPVRRIKRKVKIIRAFVSWSGAACVTVGAARGAGVRRSLGGGRRGHSGRCKTRREWRRQGQGRRKWVTGGALSTARRPPCHQPPATPPNNTILLLCYFINDTRNFPRIYKSS